jgi:hypothetical protein
MDLLVFKKYLNENNIYLFDAQYRIILYRYNNYINLNLLQPNLLYSINKKKNILLYHFIMALLTNNITKINYIVSLI